MTAMKSVNLTFMGGLTQLVALLTFCTLAKRSDGPLKLIGWKIFTIGTYFVLRRIAQMDTRHALLQLFGLAVCAPISLTLAGMWFPGLIKDVRPLSAEYLCGAALLALGAFVAYGVAWGMLRLGLAKGVRT